MSGAVVEQMNQNIASDKWQQPPSTTLTKDEILVGFVKEDTPVRLSGDYR